ncbi:MAG: sulfatase-like hydrolase/transferase, partial [Myxococcales bacterium]|nr:sulfatase-like hydrolase/transferase [Myxococcales bacterium]
GLAWLDAGGDAPSFLWLHYFDVHQPYTPAPRFRPAGEPPPGVGWRFDRFREVRSGHFVPDEAQRDWIARLYLAEVRQLDAELGRLLDALRARGRYDDALIVLVSDHGEELWDHGGFEHGHTVHDELLRVPLFVKLPGARHAGVVRGPVSIEAVAPTVLALCGQDAAGAWLSSAPLVGPDGAPRAPG